MGENLTKTKVQEMRIVCLYFLKSYKTVFA